MSSYITPEEITAEEKAELPAGFKMFRESYNGSLVVGENLTSLFFVSRNTVTGKIRLQGSYRTPSKGTRFRPGQVSEV